MVYTSLREKREYPRIGIIAHVRVTQLPYKGFSCSAKMLNISPKGMYLETDAPLLEGELLKVQIIEAKELSVGGTCHSGVVWYLTVHEPYAGLHRYGVQFLHSPLFFPFQSRPAMSA